MSSYPNSASGVISLFVGGRKDKLTWQADIVPGVGEILRTGFWLTEKQVNWVKRMYGAKVIYAFGKTKVIPCDNPGEFGIFDWTIILAPNGAGTLKIIRKGV